MNYRRILQVVLTVVVVGSMLLGTGSQQRVSAQTSNPPSAMGPYHVDGTVTQADREAAAANNAALGLKPGLAGQNSSIKLPMQQGTAPHYFGPYANYANSPLPKGAVATIVVDAGGSGYTDAHPPVVTITDVYGTGSGAIASATVVNGVVTAITISNGGTSYSAPWVSIDDIATGSAGTGKGAAATATIGGPFDPGSGIRKFMDSLPGLTPAGASTLGKYIPIAEPDTTSFPGNPLANPVVPAADYYEIALIQFETQFSADLPATTVRGYIQLSTSVVPGLHVALFNPDGTPILLPDGTQAYGVDNPQYLGPMIVASKDKPVRIKFYNLLPTNAGGDLFIPADTTYMGAGEGTLDAWGMACDPMMMDCANYSQNRGTIHLHGGLVPWISDGTPHQWTTPAGENTQYPKGVSVAYVPDMWYDATGAAIPSCAQQTTCAVAGATNNPGDGSLTFYYNNQQSARLMFYHDHSYGITRLNVYAGEAAGYLLTDQVEQDLINGTNNSGVNPGLVKALPDLGIPLIIQDKTFVDATTIAGQDPTWRWGTGPVDPATGYRTPKTGDLWVSSVYMPAQNPWDVSGTNAFGRWMYGPWFWPPTGTITNGPVANPYYDPNCNSAVTWCEPPMQPGTPSPASGMEAFNDTPVVNGEAYPYLEVDPTVVRFRILNAANDRFLNLSWFVADPSVVTSDLRTNTEVKMVPAISVPGWPATWPGDGRAGGVPDPATAGPDWVQIGTEGGFLPSPVSIPAQPIAWNMNPTTFNFGNVSDHGLLLGTAERADVLVDFSQYAGQTLILYNDAPAAFPALAPYYDYYTGDPAQMDTGGAPTTQAGYGPNTHTIMQVRVRGNAAGSTVSSVTVTSGGSDYAFTPEVVFSGGGLGSGAAATAYGSIDHVTVLNPGSGYTVAPTVSISSPDLPAGVQAVATAQLVNGRVSRLLVTNPGSGYLTAPIITISGDGVNATAVSALTVTEIQVTDPGSGYTLPPSVLLIGGGGYGATAAAHLVALGPGYDFTNLNALFTKGSVNANLTVNPGVFATGQDPIIVPQAAYNAALGTNVPDTMAQYVQIQDVSKSFFNGPLTSISLTAPGTGYTSAPLVNITGGGATTNATASATIAGSTVNSITVVTRGSGYTTAPTVVIGAPVGVGGVTARATAVLTRIVNTITVTNGGNNYTSPPTVRFTGGGGSGATATATISGGRVTAVTVTWGGSGYSTAPTISFSGGGGNGARATASMTNAVNSVLLTNGGSGYNAAPLISFTGGGGTGASATATYLPGYVSTLTLLSGGAGYTSAPTISFNNTGTNGSGAAAVANPITIVMEPKAMHDEMGAAYDQYGRMSGLLGLELRGTNNLTQNILLYGYASPPVDIFKDTKGIPLGTLGDGTQIWQIIHNGVDTHPIHFHLFNVQLINRVSWDGILLPPDANELGWKETVRVNPLEQTIVAMRPIAPTQPFDIPNSVRLLDPTMPEGSELMPPPGGYVDPAGNPTAGVLNLRVNFGWEYVWHCHILSHEEMDMMHNLTLAVAPLAPGNVTLLRQGIGNGQSIRISWLDNSTNETGFRVERSTTPVNGPWVTLAVAPPGTGRGSTLTYTDNAVARRTTYYYRVTAENVVGDTQVFPAPAIGYPTVTASSVAVSAAPVTTLAPTTEYPVFADSFETGLDAWTGSAGDVQAVAEAVVGPNGGELGMRATLNSADPEAAYVYDATPDNLNTYDASFAFDSHGTLTGETPVDIFTGLDQNGLPTFGVQYQSTDGISFQIRGWVMINGEPVYTEWFTFTTSDPENIPATTHKIEIGWASGTKAGFTLYIDDVLVQSLTGDTSASLLDLVVLGPSIGVDSSVSGSMFFDEFSSSVVDALAPLFTIFVPIISR